MASRTRPRRAIVNFHGIEHEMNMPVLRLVLVRRQVVDEFHFMEQLADAVGIGQAGEAAEVSPGQLTEPHLTVDGDRCASAAAAHRPAVQPVSSPLTT